MVISVSVMPVDTLSAIEALQFGSRPWIWYFYHDGNFGRNGGRKRLVCGIRTGVRRWWTGFGVTCRRKLRVCQREKW